MIFWVVPYYCKASIQIWFCLALLAYIAYCLCSQLSKPVKDAHTSSLGLGLGSNYWKLLTFYSKLACNSRIATRAPAGACKHLNYDLFSGLWFVPGTLAGTKVKPVVHPITTSSPYRHTWSYVPNFVDYHSPTSR